MKTKRAKRGMALLLTVLMLPMLALMAFALTTSGISNLNSARVRENSKQAVYVAEAGAEEGLQRLKSDPEYSTQAGWSLSSAGAPFAHSLGGPERASVKIWSNRYGMSVKVVEETGAEVPPDYGYILSTASEPGGKTVRRVAILCKLIGGGPSPWNYAAVGFDFVKLGGSKTVIDSYDSGQGSFAATRLDFNSASTTVGGHVASGRIPQDASLSGNVQFNSQNKIAGRLDMLTGGVTNGVAGQEFISQRTLTRAIPSRALVIPELETAALTSGTLGPGKRYVGAMTQPITLSGSGDYVFDDFDSEQVSITPGSKVNIYVTGNHGGSIDFTMLNVIRNPNGNNPEYVPNPQSPAKDVTFYVGPQFTSLDLQGSKAYASCRFFAPNTDLLLRSANFNLYGSLSAKSLENRGNMELHYDRNMSEPDIPPDAIPSYRQRL